MHFCFTLFCFALSALPLAAQTPACVLVRGDRIEAAGYADVRWVIKGGRVVRAP